MEFIWIRILLKGSWIAFIITSFCTVKFKHVNNKVTIYCMYPKVAKINISIITYQMTMSMWKGLPLVMKLQRFILPSAYRASWWVSTKKRNEYWTFTRCTITYISNKNQLLLQVSSVTKSQNSASSPSPSKFKRKRNADHSDWLTTTQCSRNTATGSQS